MEYVRGLRDCGADAVASVGGKASGLGALLAMGVPVPDGFAVTTGSYEASLQATGLAERLGRVLATVDPEDMAGLREVSAAARRLVEDGDVPDEVSGAIRRAYRELTPAGQEAPVAIRSSATAEDAATTSFAGQLDTFLWIQGEDEVLRHVVRVWAGLFSPGAIVYRARAGIRSDEVSMGVVVQKMVEARAAGVLFTLNPLNGDRSKVMLEASVGLGEAVVAGEVNPDRFLVDKVTFEVLERTIACKDVEYRFDPGRRKVVRAPVAPERREEPCLSQDEVVALARLGKHIEHSAGSPQDVEWAIEAAGEPNGRISVLQMRPESVWSRRAPDPVADPKESAVDYVLASLLARKR
jgi:pyruvate,water dikinase